MKQDLYNPSEPRVDQKLVYDPAFLEETIRKYFFECVDELLQEMKKQEDLPTLTIQDVCRILRKSKKTVYSYIAKGFIEPYYYGRTPMFYLADIREFMGMSDDDEKNHKH